jgi:hypothetical protein
MGVPGVNSNSILSGLNVDIKPDEIIQDAKQVKAAVDATVNAGALKDKFIDGAKAAVDAADDVATKGSSLLQKLDGLSSAAGVVINIATLPTKAENFSNAMADGTTQQQVSTGAQLASGATSLARGAIFTAKAAGGQEIVENLAKRVIPGSGYVMLAADTASAAAVMADDDASDTKKVAAGVAVLGTMISMAPIPGASAVGAIINIGANLVVMNESSKQGQTNQQEQH